MVSYLLTCAQGLLQPNLQSDCVCLETNIRVGEWTPAVLHCEPNELWRTHLVIVFLTFTLTDIRLCQEGYMKCCYFNILPIVMIDQVRREVIRKIIAFIWRDSNVKGRSPTYLLGQYLCMELRFDKVWTLQDCSAANEYSHLQVERLRIFDPLI